MTLVEKQDPLGPWKKHSGFKKGLRTDIVMGDEKAPQERYESTMSAHYTIKKLEEIGKIAGQSSGISVSNRSQKYILLGDYNTPQVTKSVTKEAMTEKHIVHDE